VDVHNDGGGTVRTGSLEDSRAFEHFVRVKDLTGGFSVGVGVANRHGRDIISRPGIFNQEIDSSRLHGILLDHDGKVGVDTDIGFVANIRKGNERTIEAIGDLGLADGNARNNEFISDVRDLVGDGAGLAIFHVEVAGVTGVQVESNLRKSSKTLSGDGGFVPEFNGIRLHVAGRIIGGGIDESDGHHANTVGVEDLLYLEYNTIDVLGLDGDRRDKIGEGFNVSDGFLELGIGGYGTIDRRKDFVEAFGRRRRRSGSMSCCGTSRRRGSGGSGGTRSGSTGRA